MNTNEFVQKVYAEIIEGGDTGYRELFSTTKVESVTDPYFKKVLPFFHSLSKEQREILFLIMRQVAVDTLSALFGVLDGVSEIDEQVIEFDLSPGEGQGKLRDIQAHFLEYDDEFGMNQ